MEEKVIKQLKRIKRLVRRSFLDRPLLYTISSFFLSLFFRFKIFMHSFLCANSLYRDREFGLASQFLNSTDSVFFCHYSISLILVEHNLRHLSSIFMARISRQIPGSATNISCTFVGIYFSRRLSRNCRIVGLRTPRGERGKELRSPIIFTTTTCPVEAHENKKDLTARHISSNLLSGVKLFPNVF